MRAKSWVMFKHPWALTWDATVYVWTYINTAAHMYRPWSTGGAVWRGLVEGARSAWGSLSRGKVWRYPSSLQQSTSTLMQTLAWTTMSRRVQKQTLKITVVSKESTCIKYTNWWNQLTFHTSYHLGFHPETRLMEKYKCYLPQKLTIHITPSTFTYHIKILAQEKKIQCHTCLWVWTHMYMHMVGYLYIRDTLGQVCLWVATASTQWPQRWELPWTFWREAGWLSREDGDRYLRQNRTRRHIRESWCKWFHDIVPLVQMRRAVALYIAETIFSLEPARKTYTTY